MGSARKGQGRSRLAAHITDQELLIQARQYAKRTGIRLLPGGDFQFTPENRADLARWLEQYTDGVEPFIDEVEELATQYCTDVRQRDGALSPAALKRELTQIRDDALNVIRSFHGLGIFSTDYSAKSEDAKTLLYLECDDDSLSLLQETVGNLVLLIQAIDSAVSGDIESIDSELKEIRADGNRFDRLSRALHLSMQKKYRLRATPSRGRPSKEAEKKLIRDIALQYEKHFGRRPPTTPDGKFVDFISSLFYCIYQENAQEDYMRLIRGALKNL